jgi:hypothetical protein
MTDQPVSTTDELNHPAKPDSSLLANLTELYWSLGEYSIDDRRRMKAVIHEISQIIRTWAPDPGQARICYLAINEVADRLVRECEA